MIYNWYQIFNLNDFIDSGLTSKTITVFLAGVGEKSIMITQGDKTSIVIDGVMLTVLLNNRNPYSMDDYAIYQDAENNIWLGVPNES